MVEGRVGGHPLETPLGGPVVELRTTEWEDEPRGLPNTLIAVAEDCRATTGERPLPRGGKATVASIQYDVLAGAPSRWTQEDVLLASSPGVRGRDDLEGEELERLRDEYFSEPGPVCAPPRFPRSSVGAFITMATAASRFTQWDRRSTCD